MIQIFDDDIDPKLQILDFCVKMQFLTAIDVVIAVLEVSPKLLILSALSFAELCRILLSFAALTPLLSVVSYC